MGAGGCRFESYHPDFDVTPAGIIPGPEQAGPVHVLPAEESIGIVPFFGLIQIEAIKPSARLIFFGWL